MASTGIPPVPQAKNVVVFKNGDPFFTGRKLVINQRQILTFETFLNEVTNNISAPVAVRNIYTPSGRHRVLALNQLQNGCYYVAAGFEKFKKIDYLQQRSQKPNGTRRKNEVVTRAVYPNRRDVSARWRKYMQMPCIVNIFRNGDLLSPPFRLIIPKHVMPDWEKILAMVTEKANIRTGAVRRLCTTEGQVMKNGAQLESGQYYVAVGSEKFKNLPYLELLVSKSSLQNALRHQEMMRCKNRGKECTVAQDGASDSVLLPSPSQLDKRRVQSTGDAAEAGVLMAAQTVRSKGKSTRQDRSSVFFAKPVQVKLNRNVVRESQAGTGNRGGKSVFKVTEKRSELQGAQEIPDDEDTRVEFPIDKMVAEVIEDEIITESAAYHVDQPACLCPGLECPDPTLQPGAAFTVSPQPGSTTCTTFVQEDKPSFSGRSTSRILHNRTNANECKLI
ncbi:doublecortin domain-containing protein 2B [Mobula birostris]|uniref:doublecortin domain-containing protein 2B n=1 Tax=Mobula birostris TaxID=1983395 RepID=UPI003B27D077